MDTLDITKEEKKVLRSIRNTAAKLIREQKTSIHVDPAEFELMFAFEEMHLMAQGSGKPITCFYYGLLVEHTNTKGAH